MAGGRKAEFRAPARAAEITGLSLYRVNAEKPLGVHILIFQPVVDL